MKPCLAWLQREGFSCDVVEAKAVFSRKVGRYMAGMTVPGMPDIVGCAPTGVACFIEAKAPGRRQLRPAQRAFLIDKIEHRAFAVCVDSVERLADTYARFLQLPPSLAKSYLLDELPPEPRTRKKRGPDPIF